MTIADIAWIDDFARGISDYVYVRERDSLLILLPNQAYKLNSTGVTLLKRVMNRTPIHEALRECWPDAARDERALEEVHNFFCDVRSLVMGCLGEGKDRKAVENVPFSRLHNTLPVLSEIALTYRCNLSCKFCYAGCGCTSKPNSADMTTDEVTRVLEIIRHEAEVPSVSWTGGEPTLREDLVKLTRRAADIGLRVNLITNGTLVTPALASALKDSGLRSAQVSIEGPNAEVHDSLTKISGSFAQTTAGISALAEAGIHVHTNTTISSANAPYLDGIVELAARLGMERLSMNMVIPCGSAPNADVTITYSQTAELIYRVKETARAAGIEFLWYSPTPYCIFNPIAARLGGKSCAACDGLLSVAPNGDVLPCSSLSRSVGNLLKTPFDRVWNSRKASYWRNKQYAHRICKKCELFDVCTGACPIYWKAMGLKEIKQARRPAGA